MPLNIFNGLNCKESKSEFIYSKMEIHSHNTENLMIAEVISDGIVIDTIESGSDLVGNLYYSGFDHVILHKNNIHDAFFDLKSGIAGEILQKFSNHRMKVFILGDFSEIASKSLQNFIYESNNGKQVNFLPSLKDAIDRITA